MSKHPSRSIWIHSKDKKTVQIIDQRFLPHRLIIKDLKKLQDAFVAIKDMQVRGAPLIGVTAAYGMYLATIESINAEQAARKLISARPTAVNLEWAVKKCLKAIKSVHEQDEKIEMALSLAEQIEKEDVEVCRQIGIHGLEIIRKIAKRKKGKPVNVLTHCNAGWLACVEWGTATSPIYHAFNAGIKIHVWVDETRPRNQGSSLTAWELLQRKVPHTVIADNAGGHLMQHGLVDLVIVGTDRTTRTGDVANKIGTYLKALAAKDNHVPFYVAAPSSSIDWNLKDGLRQIPIEERNADEVRFIQGLCRGRVEKVLLTPQASKALNPAFDVTPRELVTGLMTERGVCSASEKGLNGLFPENY